mgnify:CR=1 FL=1
MGTRRIALVILVCMQVVLTGIGLARWQQGNGTARTPLVRLDTGVPTGVPLTIESALTAATQRAQAWSADAFVFAAGMQVDWPVDASAAGKSELPGNGWVLFTFGAAKQGVGLDGNGATLSMLIDRLSGVVIDEREMGWSWEPARRLAVATYPISATVALFAADVSAGLAYRTACPQYRHLSRVSLVPGSSAGGAYWLVTYEDARSAGRPALNVRTDATTGQVSRDDRTVDQTAC